MNFEFSCRKKSDKHSVNCIWNISGDYEHIIWIIDNLVVFDFHVSL